MKKSLLLLIVAIFTLTTAFDANAWTDRNTFGLKGPVKNVSGSGELSFDKNGKYISRLQQRFSNNNYKSLYSNVFKRNNNSTFRLWRN